MIATIPVHSDGMPLTFKDFYRSLCETYGRDVHQRHKIAHVFTKNDIPAMEQYIRDQVERAEFFPHDGPMLRELEENRIGARMLIQRINEYDYIQVAWKQE